MRNTGKGRRRGTGRHRSDPVDRLVGERVRAAREAARLTQVAVGKALGMSFQVVQKYEQGEIRISASRLWQLARLLGRPVGSFFEAKGKEAAARADPPNGDGREAALIAAWRRIGKRAVQQDLLRLVRTMSEREAQGGGDAKPAIEPVKTGKLAAKSGR